MRLLYNFILYRLYARHTHFTRFKAALSICCCLCRSCHSKNCTFFVYGTMIVILGLRLFLTDCLDSPLLLVVKHLSFFTRMCTSMLISSLINVGSLFIFVDSNKSNNVVYSRLWDVVFLCEYLYVSSFLLSSNVFLHDFSLLLLR